MVFKDMRRRLKSQPLTSPCLKPGASLSFFGERRSLESNLLVILPDLLKWQFQADQRSGSISKISNLKSKI